MQEKAAEYVERLARVRSGDAAALRRADAESELEENNAALCRAQDELGSLASAAGVLRLKRLKTNKARLDDAQDKLSRLNAPSTDQLNRLRALRDTAAGEESSLRSAADALEKARVRAKTAKDDAEAARLERVSCADIAVLSLLRDSHNEVERREAARDAAGGGLPAWLPAAAAVLLAAAGAVLVWFSSRSAAGAVAAGLAAGAGAYFALRGGVGGGKAEAQSALASAAQAFEARRDALGGVWVGLGRSEVKIRIEAESARTAQAESGLAEAQKRFQQFADELAQAELLAGKAGGTAKADLAAALAALGAAKVENAEDLASKAKVLSDQIEKAGADTRSELAGDFKPDESMGANLLRAIAGLEKSAEGVPADLASLSHEDAEARRKRVRADVERLTLARKSLDATHLKAADDAAAARDHEGLSPTELDLRRRRAQKALAEIELTRLAAKAAREELEVLKGSTDSVLREILGDASDILSRLTDGRYSSLQVGADPLKEEQFSVEHRSLGRKTLPWVSRGMRDTIWFSMRLAMARKAFPEGAFFILDEPFHHLDPKRLLRALKALLDESLLPGWQVVILTKDPAVAQALEAEGLITAPGRLSL